MRSQKASNSHPMPTTWDAGQPRVYAPALMLRDHCLIQATASRGQGSVRGTLLPPLEAISTQ